MKKLEVGKLYMFDYQALHDVVKIKGVDYILCSLSTKERNKLINDICSNKENIENYFLEQKNNTDLQEYFKILKKYNNIVNKRKESGSRKKSNKEIEYQSITEETKDIYFSKNKKKKPNNIRARNIFIRYFIPDNITFLNFNLEKNADNDTIVKCANMNNKIVAVYSGKHYTANGLIVHKWYILNSVYTPETYVDEKMKKFIEEVA